MSEVEVSFRHYHPRIGLKEEVNRLVREMSAELPKGSDLKVVITDSRDTYVFSGVVVIGAKFFSSEIVVKKADVKGRGRLWQMEPLGLMLRDLALQAKHRA